MSGWLSGMTPQPISVGITGTPVSSANSTSSSDASALTIPPPATMSGRSAPASRSNALSICARLAAGDHLQRGLGVNVVPLHDDDRLGHQLQRAANDGLVCRLDGLPGASWRF